MNGEDEVTSGMATGIASPASIGLLKTSKRRKPKKPSLLEKAAERGRMGYTPYPTTAAEADSTMGIVEE